MEINSLVHLKLFPRSKRGMIDDGKVIMQYLTYEYDMYCPLCKGVIIETVSLEYCGQCGYIQADYWGLTPGKEYQI